MILANGINDLVCFGDNRDVVRYVTNYYVLWRDQPDELTVDIKDLDIDTQCRSIFDYLVRHVSYKLDPPGVQYIKSPARLLYDGCGDCKSLTIFIASCLHCLGIKHVIRFVNFDGGLQYTHVYPVAIDESGKEIILDMCELDYNRQPRYNYARAYRYKQDYQYE